MESLIEHDTQAVKYLPIILVYNENSMLRSKEGYILKK